MDGIVALLSASPLILATANLVAVCTAIWAAYRVFRFLARFVSTVYERNIKTAFRRIIRKNYLQAFWLSYDLHLYISYLVSRFILIGGVVLNISVIQGGSVKTRQEFVDNPPRWSFESYEAYVSYFRTVDLLFSFIALALLFVVFYYVFRLYFTITAVWRIRSRWLTRRSQRLNSVKK